jgi:hypothetical protein
MGDRLGIPGVLGFSFNFYISGFQLYLSNLTYSQIFAEFIEGISRKEIAQNIRNKTTIVCFDIIK